VPIYYLAIIDFPFGFMLMKRKNRADHLTRVLTARFLWYKLHPSQARELGRRPSWQLDAIVRRTD
jgi:hypothetical protein